MKSAQIHIGATALTATREEERYPQPHWTGHKHSNGDGLGYKCLSCGVAQPIVFRFIGGAGARAAEEYAEKRLEIDAVGKGWYC